MFISQALDRDNEPEVKMVKSNLKEFEFIVLIAHLVHLKQVIIPF